MNKKVQLVIWGIIAIIAIILLGVTGYGLFKNLIGEVTHPEVSFEIDGYGTVKMELYPEYAPNTVANFIKLVENGYYSDKVVYGKDNVCMYMGRDIAGEAVNPRLSLISDKVEVGSSDDYEYTIPGEFIANGYSKNTLKHEKGVVSLIRNDYTQYISSLAEESYNSGNAQIGIMMGDEANNLNGVYAGFGRIIEGMDILEKMYNELEIGKPETQTSEENSENTEASNTEENSEEEKEEAIKTFKLAPAIKSTSVEKHGIDYGMPKVQEAFDYNAYLYQMLGNYSN